MKSKAYLNLLSERESGRMVNTKDIKKHRNDVLKLVAAIGFPRPITVHAEIWESVQRFARLIEEELETNPKSLRDALQRTPSDIRVYLDILRNGFVKE